MFESFNVKLWNNQTFELVRQSRNEESDMQHPVDDSRCHKYKSRQHKKYQGQKIRAKK